VTLGWGVVGNRFFVEKKTAVLPAGVYLAHSTTERAQAHTRAVRGRVGGVTGASI
jgi:hypothetical protein